MSIKSIFYSPAINLTPALPPQAVDSKLKSQTLEPVKTLNEPIPTPKTSNSYMSSTPVQAPPRIIFPTLKNIQEILGSLDELPGWSYPIRSDESHVPTPKIEPSVKIYNPFGKEIPTPDLIIPEPSNDFPIVVDGEKVPWCPESYPEGRGSWFPGDKVSADKILVWKPETKRPMSKGKWVKPVWDGAKGEFHYPKEPELKVEKPQGPVIGDPDYEPLLGFDFKSDFSFYSKLIPLSLTTFIAVKNYSRTLSFISALGQGLKNAQIIPAVPFAAGISLIYFGIYALAGSEASAQADVLETKAPCYQKRNGDFACKTVIEIEGRLYEGEEIL